jgi:hypothetical protein
VTSKLQSSKVTTLARATATQAAGGAAPSASGPARPRRPAPLPWSPASSAFSRPAAPPLAEVSLDTVTKAVPMPTRELVTVRPAAPASTAASKSAPASAAASKPAPATLPPPPVGMPKAKPAPETLPPPPGISARSFVRPVPVMPMPGPAMPATRSVRPSMVVPVALGGTSNAGSVVMMTAVGASRPIVTRLGAGVGASKASAPAGVESVVEVAPVEARVEVVEAPMVASVVPSMVETAPIAVAIPEVSGVILVSEDELEELFEESAVSAQAVGEVAPIVEVAPVIEAAAIEVAPVIEAAPEPVPQSAFAPVTVERCDSVPLVMLASRMASFAPAFEIEPPQQLASVIMASTLDARVRQAMAASSHAPAARPSRRRIGIMLGAAASLLLAVGIAASASSSASSDDEATARESLPLTASLNEPSTLVKAWMSRTQPSEPAATLSVEPSTDAAPLPSSNAMLAVATPTEVIEPALEPAPQPRRSRRARPRSHAPAVVQDAAPEPTPTPERSSKRRSRTASAEELLHDAEVALALGDAKEAYRLARKSRATGEQADAASLVARSACRIGERDEARRALKDLPLLERGAVRRDCRRSGSRIGL